MVKSCLLLSIEGGATVAGSVAVWDIIDFQFSPQAYSVSKDSPTG
jgi:hypothetical protein